MTAVQSEITALVARQQRLADGIAAEARHQMDTVDAAFARLACDHPDKCACPEDYPGWTPGGTR